MMDFLSLRKSVEQLGTRRRELRGLIESLLRQREDIATAPPARVEMLQYMAGWTKSLGDQFDATFKKRMEPILRKPDSVDFNNGRAGRVLTVLGMTPNPESEPSPAGMDGALCWLLRDTMTAALTRAVDQMDIPFGLPRDERRARLAKLDIEIEGLVSQEQELIDAARAAGLVMEDA